ncbi:Glucosyltransferase-like protein [Phlyctochytrium bullatum]|nr:Glucosyltransferase-like protein [Phlyctochytrium bullatum]
MHGDFEAQRHWLEITHHLPPSQWYFYDLEYWGLDYPPLTAYHSKLLGWIAHNINSSWVALDTSRGIESPDLKFFMRNTVIVTELVVYVSAAAYVAFKSGMFNTALRKVGRGFKQMSLYYSIPVFFYLLGKVRQQGLILFVKLGVTVILTFAALLAPFLTSTSSVAQVFHRLFPMQRGLYEDKVANVWCALSVAVKLRAMMDVSALAGLSIVATLLAVLPSSLHAFWTPTPRNFMFALTNGALAFFLFSFQVHEKSILIPLLPLTMIMPEEPMVGLLVHAVSMFSMYPLLRKDGLAIPSIAMTTLFVLLASGRASTLNLRTPLPYIYAIMASLITLDFAVPPPPRYPDLYVVLNVVVSCAVFAGAFLYLNLRQFRVLPTGVGAKAKTEKVKAK